MIFKGQKDRERFHEIRQKFGLCSSYLTDEELKKPSECLHSNTIDSLQPPSFEDACPANALSYQPASGSHDGLPIIPSIPLEMEKDIEDIRKKMIKKYQKIEHIKNQLD